MEQEKKDGFYGIEMDQMVTTDGARGKGGEDSGLPDSVFLAKSGPPSFRSPTSALPRELHESPYTRICASNTRGK
jgi:hypothetical protein